ncbi:MAG TPA: replication-associated recombination protein A [Leptospiraceae bacterium]|nr:replication-associated recombination protein A [Leptospiraceae bacterium]
MQDHLFSPAAPLPQRLRPSSFEEFHGQQSLIDQLAGKKPHSMILYGPPGCGKTTLALLLAKKATLPFRSLSAVASGVKELRDVIEEARKTGRILLFVDEIHRFSKSQQDALLHAVEEGWLVLIGATTENPSFEVISPLLSRCQVYKLGALSSEDLDRILERALMQDSLLKGKTIEEEAREALIQFAGGDARKLLRVVEIAAEEADIITLKALNKSIQNFARQYDRAGENHYDVISAFIKSMRGSDPDAALLYLAIMIDAGEDPLFIARRIIIFASEDVGNAAPQGLQVAVSAFQALERVGMPEGRIILAQAATFLASCPKSNAAYRGIDAALEFIQGKRISVPNHLRNAPTTTHRKEGAGKGYKYPHEYSGHYVEQEYMPDDIRAQFYFPTREGQEVRLLERLRMLSRKDRKYE